MMRCHPLQSPSVYRDRDLNQVDGINLKRAIRQYCYISVHGMCKIIQQHWPNIKFHPLLLSEPLQFVRPLTFQGVRGIAQSSWPTSQMLRTEVSYWLVVDLCFKKKPCSNASQRYSLGLKSADLVLQFSEPWSHHIMFTGPFLDKLILEVWAEMQRCK